MINKNHSYPDFVENTGFGSGGGLCGWNCRHNFIPFDPETMKNNLSQYGLEENEKAYKISQYQRLCERRIRKSKRKVFALENAIKNTNNILDQNILKKDLLRSKNLLKKQNNNYKNFCKQNNVKPYQERLKIPKTI